MNKTALSIAAAICAFGASTAAHADSVGFPGFAHGSETVTFSVPGQPGPAARTGSASAGGFLTSLNGGPTFTSYCVDLYQYISFGTTYTDYVPVGGAHVFANTGAYVDLSRLYAVAGSIVDAVHEAAFQMAVWEIAYETSGTYSLTDGVATFGGSSGATGYASSWLSQILNTRANAGPMVSVLESAGQQDVIYAPVPEPAEIALMLGGLAAVAGVVRRRKKAGAAA